MDKNRSHMDTVTGYLGLKKEVFLTEGEKLKKEYFNTQARFYIESLLDDRVHIYSARNYYASKRNVLDFEYLEDIYGMQNPIDLRFTNIIKPRVDALVGMSLLSEPEFSVAYTDLNTFKKVEKEKMDAVLKEIQAEVKIGVNAGAREGEAGQGNPQGTKDNAPSQGTKKWFDDTLIKFGPNYKSSYEIAAQHVLNLIQTDAEIGLDTIKKEVSKDYFITGECYTKEEYVGDGKDPKKLHIAPEYLHTNRPTGDRTLENTDVIVYKKTMTVHNVIKLLGDKITKQDAEEIFTSYTRLSSDLFIKNGPGDANLEINNPNQMDLLTPLKTGWSDVAGGLPNELVDFYHIEWLASTKIPKSGGGYVYREDRYECYRIGPDIYVGGRRCDEAPRKQDKPWKTTLSYKGLINTTPSGGVESMSNSLREIQDLYDIIMFFRNNLVANSGVSGSRVNVAAIPKSLGKKFMPRLLKWITLRKQGVELIDPTEDGAQLFQHYGDFDAGLDGRAMEAINAVLESLTVQADIISGVPRQMLGVIEQRDAVENVKVGINQVSVLSLEMFRDIDKLMCRGMQETLDNFKWAYRNKTKKGVYKLGVAMVAFILSPSKFSLTDYQVSVISAGIENAKLIKIQQLAKELVGAGAVDPNIVVEIVNKKSIAEIENILQVAIAKKKEETMNIQAMEKQLEEATNQAKQLQAEVDRLTNNAAKLEKEKLEVEKAKDKSDQMLRSRELDIIDKANREKNKIDKKDIAVKEAVVELEREQLLFGEGNAKEINNNKF